MTVKKTTIRIGVYGRTQAGKTRFLYETLNHWEKQRRIIEQPASFHEFMKHAASHIESRGKSVGSSGFQEIEFTVRNSDKTSKDNQYSTVNQPSTKFIIQDLRGEVLENDIDNLESAPKNRPIPSQVRTCDAFLYFFDPTNWETPASINKHHEEELNRAGDFIEYVLMQRQNRYLPIIFLATRFDTWENDSDISRKSDEWLQKAHSKLSDLYKDKLKSHFPEKLIDIDETCLRVSAIRPDMLDHVFDKISKLVAEGEKFRRKDKNKMIALVLTFVLLILLSAPPVLWALLQPDPGTKPGKMDDPPRVKITTQDEDQIQVSLGKIQQRLKALPSDSALVTEADAKSVNGDLDWLFLTATTNSDLKSETTHKKVVQTLNATASAIEKKIPQKQEDQDHYLVLLSHYLEDLPDTASVSQALAGLQKKYWELYLDSITQKLANVVKRRNQVGSPPDECWREIIEELTNALTQVEKCKVYGPSQRKELMESILTTKSFCEDRRKTGTYSVNLRVLSAKQTEASQRKWHTLTIQSADKTIHSYTLVSKQEDENTVTFSTKEESFKLDLGIGRSVDCTVSSLKPDTTEWTKEFKYDLVQNNPGPYGALGMPLLYIGSDSETTIDKNKYSFRLQFTGTTSVPQLLRDAVEKKTKGSDK